MLNKGDIGTIKFRYVGRNEDYYALLKLDKKEILLEHDTDTDTFTLHPSDIDSVSWEAPPMEPLPNKVGAQIIATAAGFEDLWLVLVRNKFETYWHVVDKPANLLKDKFYGEQIKAWKYYE